MLTSTPTGAAIALIVSVPALIALWRVRHNPAGTVQRVVIQAVAVCVAAGAQVVLWRDWPGDQVAWGALILFGGGWLIEVVGHRTGFPFGRYQYGTFLRPRVGGVPLAVPAGYMAVVPTAWGVADLLVAGSRGWDFVCVAGLVAAVWDLILDPLFVHWKAWTWAHPGGYFGVPWTNFAGWFAVTGVMTILVRPGPLAGVPFLWAYTFAWGFGTAALFAHLPARRPAVVSGAVMGAVLALAWFEALRGP